jgi:hypothetical protein
MLSKWQRAEVENVSATARFADRVDAESPVWLS